MGGSGRGSVAGLAAVPIDIELEESDEGGGWIGRRHLVHKLWTEQFPGNGGDEKCF